MSRRKVLVCCAAGVTLYLWYRRWRGCPVPSRRRHVYAGAELRAGQRTVAHSRGVTAYIIDEPGASDNGDIAASYVCVSPGAPGGGRGGSVLTVLIHGFVGSSAYFDGLARELARRGRRVLRPDLMGRGASTYREGDDMDARSYAAQLAELLFALNEAAAVDIVGYSMGGGVALAFAATYPQRVRTLTLLAPVGAAAFRETIPVPLRLLFQLPVVGATAAKLVGSRVAADAGKPEKWDHEWDDPGSSTSRREREDMTRRARDEVGLGPAAGASLAHFEWSEMEQDMHAVRDAGLPALLLWGTDDGACRYAGAAQYSAAIPALDVVPLPGRKHCMPIEHAADIAARVSSFLDRPHSGVGLAGVGRPA